MRYAIWIGLALLAGCTTTRTTNDRPTVPRDDWPTQAWEQAGDQPLPPGVARVTIERYEVDERDSTVIEAVAKYRNPNIRLQAGRLGGRNGLIVFGAKAGVSVAIRAEAESQYRRSSSSQFLLLNEGTTGSLSMLESQTRAWPVVIPIYRGAVVVETIAETITGTGMVVGVQRIGDDTVTVQLQPYFNRRMGRERLMIEELATTLTLRPGVPYVIMSNQTHEQSVATALLSRRTMEEHRQVIAILTVDVGGQ